MLCCCFVCYCWRLDEGAEVNGECATSSANETTWRWNSYLYSSNRFSSDNMASWLLSANGYRKLITQGLSRSKRVSGNVYLEVWMCVCVCDMITNCLQYNTIQWNLETIMILNKLHTIFKLFCLLNCNISSWGLSPFKFKLPWDI